MHGQVNQATAGLANRVTDGQAAGDGQVVAVDGQVVAVDGQAVGVAVDGMVSILRN